tara:strand:- start:7 stop:507 length:501 start_codon:yes stop_codon:yes gene_type:complete
MPSKLRAPSEPGDLGRIIQKIYDDLNSVIDSINTELEGISEPDEQSKAGSVAVVKEGDTYSLRGKTTDGWAKTPIRLLNSEKIKSIFNSSKFNDIDDIVSLTDSTGGTAADTIPASGGSWDDSEINVAVASLASKINELIVVSNTHNDRINTLIDKVNEIIRRIDE